MATTEISYTPTLGTLTKWTFSGWFKKSGITGYQQMIAVASGSAYTLIKFETSGEISFENYDSGGSAAGVLKTNRLFKDCSAWYHIVAVWDSANGVAGDRMKLYVNGVEETSFATDNNPDSSEPSLMCANTAHYIGSNNGSDYFNGCMSWVQLVDNAALAPTAFGSFDSTSGIWKISPGAYATPGTAGFCLAMEDRTNLDLDSSSNAYTFTTAGTLTPTKDNPSNNFATMNAFQPAHATIISTFTNGNTTTSGNNAQWQRTWSTMGITKGKWWYEVYLAAATSTTRFGWDSIDFINTGADTSYYSGITLQYNGQIAGGISGVSGYSPNNVASSLTFTAGDYLGFGINMDDETFTVYKNGSAVSGLNPYDWAGISDNSCLIANGYSVGPSANFESSSGDTSTSSFNFGNGVFGSTLLTGTTYTDSAGEGVFKYAPPTDYLAYCSNNLATYG